VEDKAIAEIVKFQEDVGLKSTPTASSAHLLPHRLPRQLGGVKTNVPVTIRKPDGTEELAPPVIGHRQGAPCQGHPEGDLNT